MSLGTARVFATLAMAGTIAADAARAQDNGASGTAVISGVVADATNGKSIGGVMVSLRAPAPGSAPSQAVARRTLTDDIGRYLFSDLPAGTYDISAARSGFVTAMYASSGAPLPMSRHVPLANGDWLRTADFSLRRAAAIGGTITDERGDPVVGATIGLLQQMSVAGLPAFVVGASTTTDDRGMYRVADLLPGSYVVSVSGKNLVATPNSEGQRRSYVTSYFPGEPDTVRPSTIDLSFGEDRSGADVRLMPLRAGRISGRIDGASGSWTGLVIRLVPTKLRAIGWATDAGNTLPNGNGEFRFDDIPPGSYTLIASRAASVLSTDLLAFRFSPINLSRTFGAGTMDIPGSAGLSLITVTVPATGSEQHLFGESTLVTDGSDVNDVVLTVRTLVSVSGRFVVDEGTERPRLAGVLLDPAGGLPRSGAPTSGVNASNEVDTFTIRNVAPGSYHVRVNPATLAVKSVSWNGRDYTASPIEVRTEDMADLVVSVTSPTGALRGRALATGVEKSGGLAIVLFPDDRDQWSNFGLFPTRIRSVLAATDGSYELPGIPAGGYYALAIDDAELNGWQDAAFLARAAGLASRLTIRWGETTSQDLRSVQVRR